jgi:hypothetical protein
MNTIFPTILRNAAKDDGTLRWSTACQAAKEHGLWDDFRTDYGTLSQFGGIDVNEFLEWLGY